MKNKVLIWVIVALVVVLAGVIVWQVAGGTSPLYAIYLRTGDLYFGELVRVPYFGLKHVYLLQVNSSNQQNPVSVQKFTNVFWGPEDFMKINRDEVVWMTQLSDASQLSKVVRENPNLVPAQGAPTTGTSPAAPSTQSQSPSSGANQ